MVIAIIALLVSILVPSLGEAQWHTKVAVCSQNLHSVGIAAAQYVSSWGYRQAVALEYGRAGRSQRVQAPAALVVVG